MISGSKQDQKLDFHPKVFNRATDKETAAVFKPRLTQADQSLMA
jgi:hypothetical protein